jgi:hypothetical protein
MASNLQSLNPPLLLTTHDFGKKNLSTGDLLRKGEIYCKRNRFVNTEMPLGEKLIFLGFHCGDFLSFHRNIAVGKLTTGS